MQKTLLIRTTQYFGHSFVWGAVLLSLLTVVVYIPSLNCGFVWDDGMYVTENQMLRNWDGLRNIWFEPTSQGHQYYPLTLTSFWVDYHLWGLQPFGYHLVNILLQALNAILLWRLLRRLQIPGAWLAAAIFAVHPVQVESVTWVTEGKNVLSTAFYLLSLLAYLRFRSLDEAPSHARNWWFYAAALVLFLCALLCKTVVCTLPAMILLLTWWKSDRVEKRDVFALLPFFALGVILGLSTARLEKFHIGAAGPEWALPITDRCLIAGRALWFYVGKLVWPHPLMFVYPRWTINARAWWQYSFPIGALGALVALWLMRRRIGTWPVVATWGFAGTLAPALGFFSIYYFRYSFVSDHFQYLASMWLVAMFTSAGVTALRSWRLDYGRIGVGTGILLVLGVLAWNQQRTFRDPETLWRSTLAKNPHAWMAHNNLGILLKEHGSLGEAVRHFQQATQLKPDDASLFYNLGNALDMQGRHSEAITAYRRAVQLQPDLATAQNNLAGDLAFSGKLPEAAEHYRQAIHARPDSAASHSNLGSVLLSLGKTPEAIDEFRQALRLDPDHATTHSNLGLALAAQGKFTEALEHCRRAVVLEPNSAAIRGNLARVLAAQRESESPHAVPVPARIP